MLFIYFVLDHILALYIFNMSGRCGSGESSFGGASEYMTGGVEGGGLVADMWPKSNLEVVMNPKNWTVHNLATVLMIIGVLCLVIYTFLPGTSEGWAYTAGVFAAIYLVVDGMSANNTAAGWVTTSWNDRSAASVVAAAQ